MASTLFHATSLDHGPLSSTTDLYLVHTTSATWTGTPGIMEWQTGVKRGGVGAYHFVGGNQTSGDFDLMINDNAIFSLERWTGGAFYFISVPTVGTIWLHNSVPTDGVLGSDLKPTIKISPAGKLIVGDSNSATNDVASSVVNGTGIITLNKWYYLVLHAKNGVSQQQQLLIYDGDTGALLETVNSTWTVSGAFVNPIIKWGHGTTGNWTGAEYYLDDLTIFNGDTSPGSCKVFSKIPNGTNSAGTWTPSGASTLQEAVDEAEQDGDTTYVVSSTANDVALLDLPSMGLSSDTASVRGVVSSAILRRTGSTISPFLGLRVGSSDSLSAALAVSTVYSARHMVHATNPATAAAWTVTDIDTFRGLIKQGTSSGRPVRVTTAWWDVVYQQLVAATPPPANVKRLTTDLGVPTGGTADQSPAIRAAIIANLTPGMILRLDGFYTLQTRLNIDSACPTNITVEMDPSVTAMTCGFQRLDYYALAEVTGAAKQSQVDSNVTVTGQDGWIFRNLTFKGPHTAPRYTPTFEGSTLLGINQSTNIKIGEPGKPVYFQGSGSDFVLIGGNTLPSSVITMNDCDGKIACRQLFSPVFIDGLTATNCTFRRSGRSGMDLEPLTGIGQSSKNVTVRQSTIYAVENTCAGGGTYALFNILLDRNTMAGGSTWNKAGNSGGIGDGFTVIGKNNGTYDYRYIGSVPIRTLVGTALTDRTEEADSAAGTPFALFAAANEWTYFASQNIQEKWELDIAVAGVGCSGLTVEESRAGGTWASIAVESDASSNFTLTGPRIIDLATTNNQVRAPLNGAPGDYVLQADAIFRWNGTAWVVNADTGGASIKSESSAIGGGVITLLDGTDDRFYVGHAGTFEAVKMYLLPVGAGITLAAEYWNGSAWTALSITDNTSNLTTTRQTITWTPPSDWVETIPSEATGVPPTTGGNPGTTAYYYVRFKTTTAPSVVPKIHLLVLKDTYWLWVRMKVTAMTSSPTINSIRTSQRTPGASDIKNMRTLLVENTKALFNNNTPGILGGHNDYILVNGVLVPGPAFGQIIPGIVRNNNWVTDSVAVPVANIGPEVSSTGNIGIPNTGQIGTIPSAPINPTVSAITTTTATFTITDTADTPGAEDSFSAQIRSEPGGVSGLWNALPPKTASAGTGGTVVWSLGPLAGAMPHRVQAWAVNTIGSSSVTEAAFTTLTTPPIPEPGTPILNSVSAPSSRRLVWNFTPADVNALSFVCETSPAGAATWTVRLTLGAAAVQGIWDAANPNTTYDMRVTANGRTTTSSSATRTVTTPLDQPPPGPPASSSGLSPRAGPWYQAMLRLVGIGVIRR